MGELAEPGVLDRLRARFGWLDHVVRAFTRFNDRNGSLLRPDSPTTRSLRYFLC